jgi:hypothetical protein
MKPSSRRFTLRRLMAAIALLAVILGLGIEAHRLTIRYRYCQEMARRHSAWIAMTQGRADKESERISKLDAVVSRLASLSPQSLDELVAHSGDPAFTAWFLKGQRRDLLASGGEGKIQPQELIAHIEHFWGRGWRETARSVQCGLADHVRLEKAYLYASYRPWAQVPPDPPAQAVD